MKLYSSYGSFIPRGSAAREIKGPGMPVWLSLRKEITSLSPFSYMSSCITETCAPAKQLRPLRGWKALTSVSHNTHTLSFPFQQR